MLSSAGGHAEVEGEAQPKNSLARAVALTSSPALFSSLHTRLPLARCPAHANAVQPLTTCQKQPTFPTPWQSPLSGQP